MDSNNQIMLCQESNIDMYNVEQDTELCKNNKDSNDSKSMDISDESIEFKKSVESFPDTMDSKANSQKMLCQESNTDMYNVEQNVEFCEDNKYFVIENSPLNTNRIQERLPEGRRIVDISFLWNEIHKTFDNHAQGIECQFKDWKLVNSCRYGFKTQLSFKCQMCYYEAKIWSEPTEPETVDVNTAAVAGTITTGIGFAQLEELCASMNIPCMSDKSYMKYRESVINDFEKTAMENMKMAGEAEKQLALERNETINGIPYITVVVDGSWIKRSYGNTYDSLSGVGAIICYRTKKVLFVGVRNKFCSLCDFAERNGIEPRDHKCYKNFDRNASSTSMESDAIAEGFKSSLEIHGIIYRTVIADGDSSVYQAILDSKPYCEQKVTVKKIECTNHLLRNLCKKLKAVAMTTQQKMHRKRGFVQLRNVVKNNILKIRKEIVKAIDLRKEEIQPDHKKAMELQKDILNIPSHIFGEHKRCKERGISNCDETKNYVPFLEQHGLYQKVKNAIVYLSGYSDSLLQKFTNNPAESFNSIICKEIAGKRINFANRGSYNARVAGGIVQYNTQQVLTEVHKNMGKNVPPIVETLEKRRQIKVAKIRESREMNGKSKKFKREQGTDSYYGPQSRKPDLPPDVFEQLRQNHLEKLFENGKNWRQIERDTVEQSESDLWQSLRQEMLTASNFGIICRMRPTTSCAAIVKNILFPPSIDTAAMKYGREREKIAKKELAQILKKEIKTCGLFIDVKNPCLGASPDGLIDKNGLVEIKCPLSAEHLTAEEAIKTLPHLKSVFDKKNPDKPKHRFFYQVQGQLNITQRDYCIFTVWTPRSLKIVRVNRDNVFWNTQMLPFLTRFYHDCMLPEILDSRHNRHMPIRNPKYIIEAQEAAKKLITGQKRRRQYNIDENIVEENQCCESNVLPLEATNATVTALTSAEQDDCIIVSYSQNKEELTENDIAKQKEFLDNQVIPFHLVKDNVLPVHSKINDESLDRFLRVVRNKSHFETQSVLYLEYPHIIEASRTDKSLQIIGGNCSDHWRCIFFDGTKLRVYDSLPDCTYDKLVHKEKNYIRRRYPQISANDIIFEKVQVQPDGTCCGIYAAAFATTVALGGNPCNEKYSNRVEYMRQHFLHIIVENELSPFPKW